MTFHDNSSGQIFQADFLLVEEALECLGCLMDDGTSKVGKGEVKEAGGLRWETYRIDSDRA